MASHEPAALIDDVEPMIEAVLAGEPALVSRATLAVARAFFEDHAVAAPPRLPLALDEARDEFETGVGLSRYGVQAAP